MPSPPLTPLAAAVLAVKAPESILQVQCGEGDGVLFLAREFPRARVRGTDSDPGAIRRASARVGLDPEGRVAFKSGGPRSLPFPDDHFDLVTLLDASAAASELARVLRPGGHLITASSGAEELEPGLRTRFGRWRLLRCGIEPVRSEAAGDGSFSVARRRHPGAAADPV